MSLSKHLKNTSLPLELPLHSAARLPADAAGPMVRLLLAARASPHDVRVPLRVPMRVQCDKPLRTPKHAPRKSLQRRPRLVPP